MIEVILEADPRCPRCAALYKIVRSVCNELDVPLTVKLFGTHAVSAHERDSASHTYDPEWIERFGSSRHKRLLRKARPILETFKRLGLQPFPNLVIRWHDGARIKEIVITGFDPLDKEKEQQFVKNLRMLLTLLKRVSP